MVTANTAAAPAAPAAAPAAPATVAAAVVSLLTTLATFARYHTRGAVTMVSYHVAGVPGIVFAHAAQLGWPNSMHVGPLQFTAATPSTVVPAGSTLLLYRGAVAGGKLGRSSYAAAGIAGTFTVCNTLFGAGSAPAAMLVNVVLVATPRNTGKATSAVVAAGNVAQAAKAATPVAVPAAVAQVAQQVTAAIVAATPAAQPKGKTAAQRAAHGKSA